MKNKKKVILIVEDEEELIYSLDYKFSQEGFRVVKAMNGEEGLKQAEAEKPDLILLDVVMPKMDGLTMLKELRKTKWGKDIPVLVLTNYGDVDKISTAVQTGTQGYLVKSNWDLSEIVNKVQETLKLDKSEEKKK